MANAACLGVQHLKMLPKMVVVGGGDRRGGGGVITKY